MAYDPMQELEKLGAPPQQTPDPAGTFGGDPRGLSALGGAASPERSWSAGLGQPQATPSNDPGSSFSSFSQPAGGSAPASFAAPAGGGQQGQALPGAAPNATDPNAVWGGLTDQFQKKFGRAMTGDEATALQKYAGYTGGDINQSMIDKATHGISAYSGDLSNPFGPAAGGASPASGDPGVKTNDLVQEQLQQLLQTGSTPGMTLDPNNPAITAQRSAFNRRNEQQTGRERLAMAERAAASNGLGSGGFSADIAGAENARAGRAADFEGQLLGQELSSQRDRVMQGLQMANQTGNAAMSRALQEKLGLIDADIRRTGQKGQLGLGMLQTLLGNQRAQDALGFNYAQLGANANQNFLNSILGSL